MTEANKQEAWETLERHFPLVETQTRTEANGDVYMVSIRLVKKGKPSDVSRKG